MGEIPNCRIKRDYTLTFNGLAVSIPKNEIKKIEGMQGVKRVYNDTTNSLMLTKSVPLIGADRIWQLHDSEGRNVTGKGIVVSVIDTGIDYNHPDLGGPGFPNSRVIGGYDFVNNDADPMDDHNHGTHCAGIIGANGTLKGVAPDVQFLAYKAFNSEGYGSTSNCIAAIEASVENGSDVISMSWGGDEKDPDSPLSQALENAMSVGVICVAAAGNDGPGYSTVSWPAAHPDVIAVGATDKSDNIASFSSRGPSNLGDMKPEIVAPGVNIYSTVRGGYDYMSGTSMACPHVSGTSALLLQLHPEWRQKDVKKCLMNSAIDLGYDTYTQGLGRIDAYDSALFNLSINPQLIELKNVSHEEVSVLLENNGNLPMSINTSLECRYGPEEFKDIEHFPVNYVTATPSSVRIEAHSNSTLKLVFDVPSNATIGYYLGKLTVMADSRNYSVPFSFGVGGDIIINKSVEWTNRSFLLNGNIIVEDGGNLSMENVSFVMTGLYSGQNGILVRKNGTLRATDITFTSQSKYYRNRITVEKEGAFLMENSFVNRTKGVYLYSDSSTLMNNTIRPDWNIVSSTGFGFEPPLGVMLYCRDSSPYIYNNTFTITPTFKGGFSYTDEYIPRFKAIVLVNSSAFLFKNRILANEVLSAGVYAKYSSFISRNNSFSVSAYLYNPLSTGVYLINSTAMLENNTLYGTVHVNLKKRSKATFVHTAISSIRREGGSVYYSAHFLSVLVKDGENNTISGLNVRVNDIFENRIFTGKTDSNGEVRWILCVDYSVSDEGKRYYTAHDVAVYDDTAHTSTQVNMSTDKDLTVVFNGGDTPPMRPEKPSCKRIDYDSLSIDWRASPSLDTAYYLIYKSPAETFDYSNYYFNTSMAAYPLATSFTDPHAANDWHTWHYTIVAVDEKGQKSPPSSMVWNGDWAVINAQNHANLTATVNGNILIFNGGALNLVSSDVKINSFDKENFGLVSYNGAALSIENTVLYNSSYPSFFWIRHNSSFVLKNSIIKGFGLPISGNYREHGIWVSSDRAVISNTTFERSGLIMYEASNFSVRGNIIRNNTGLNGEDVVGYRGEDGGTGAGIYLIDSEEGSLSNNTIYDIFGGIGKQTYYAGAGGSGSGIYVNNSHDLSIAGSLIHDIYGANGADGFDYGSGGNGGVGAGMYIVASSRLYLENNWISNCYGGEGGTANEGENGEDGRGAGVYLSSVGRSKIINNTVDNIRYSIYLESSEENNFFSNNMHITPGSVGIYIDAHSLNNNISETNRVNGDPVIYRYGVHVPTTIENYSLENNSMPTNLGKMAFVSCSNLTVINNTISNLTGSEVTNNVARGLYIRNVTYSVISYNHISKILGTSSSEALHIDKSSAVILAHNIIDNISAGVSSEIGGAGGFAGIKIQSSSDISFFKNTVWDVKGGTGGVGRSSTWAGKGGNGGEGGINILSSSGFRISGNNFHNISGGDGGRGGSGTWGGNGGNGGDGRIYISDSDMFEFLNNNISDIIGGLGGLGGSGSWPGKRGEDGNGYNLYLNMVNNSEIFNNSMRGGANCGVYLQGSEKNRIFSNDIRASVSSVGFYIDNESFDNNISETNTVNGDPVIYRYGVHLKTFIEGYSLGNLSAPTNLGKMAFVRCSNITVINNTISNFTGNKMTEKKARAITLVDSKLIGIKGNTITRHGAIDGEEVDFIEGIYAENSTSNITHNDISVSDGGGIYSLSAQITIYSNNITNCGDGIEIEGPAMKESIVSDNFIENSSNHGILCSHLFYSKIIGKPSFTPTTDLGYFIWAEKSGLWHLAICSGPEMHTFNGTIVSEDGYSSFTGTLGAGEYWIMTLGSEQEYTFDIFIDGERRPDLVFISSVGWHPENIPFVLKLFEESNISTVKILRNTIMDCNYGVYQTMSQNIITAGNNLIGNEHGLYTEDCSNITIYYNNFINNTIQASDNRDNSWNNSYPYGGNYWSDYNGTDIYSGSNQDDPGADCIGDVPYNITGNKDNYPLMQRAELPRHSNEYPVGGGRSNATPVISIHVIDDMGINRDSIELYVNGFKVYKTLTEISGGYNVSYTQEIALKDGENVTCRIVASDVEGHTLDYTWTFTVDRSPPDHSDEHPAIGGYAYTSKPTIYVHVTDPSGVDVNSIKMYVQGYRVDCYISPIEGGYNVSYFHEGGFSNNETVECRIVAADVFANLLDFTWNFTTQFVYEDIPVHKGWNLISYSLVASGDIEHVLNDDNVIWDYAEWYNPLDTSDHWKTHIIGRETNDLETIDNTMSIWLHVTSAGDGYLTLTGKSPTSTAIAIHAGWNLVSYPSLTSKLMSNASLPPELTKIAMYDENATYLVSEVADWTTSSFVHGHGYWLYSTADTIWTVDY